MKKLKKYTHLNSWHPNFDGPHFMCIFLYFSLFLGVYLTTFHFLDKLGDIRHRNCKHDLCILVKSHLTNEIYRKIYFCYGFKKKLIIIKCPKRSFRPAVCKAPSCWSKYTTRVAICKLWNWSHPVLFFNL